jgi:hypothetical protein
MLVRNTFSSKYNRICTAPPRSGRVANAIRLSIYVLESSNSRRLTYFMPPLVSWRPRETLQASVRVLERQLTCNKESYPALLHSPHATVFVCGNRPSRANCAPAGNSPAICPAYLGLRVQLAPFEAADYGPSSAVNDRTRYFCW